MSYALHWHEKAEDDLMGIAKYVAWRFGRTAAEKAVRKIRDDVAVLAGNPFVGIKSSAERLDGIVYRILYLKRNKIVYTIIDNSIYILAVFDNRRNPADIDILVTERSKQ